MRYKEKAYNSTSIYTINLNQLFPENYNESKISKTLEEFKSKINI